ncbi:VOC family protein [Streptomyces sp. NPDC051985]|uniref:VOC family protein n=1 Tax=Streptomyces sp. NPDC051985 TaxID=3155807 RepID=UPI0034470D21
MNTTTEAVLRTSGVRVAKVFHATLLVPDLLEAEAWYRKVFGTVSTPSMPTATSIASTFGMFTTIRDLMIDTIDPTRLAEMLGIDLFPRTGLPHLALIGWYVDQDEIVDVYRALRAAGIRVTGEAGGVTEGDDPPVSPGTPSPGTLAGRPNFVTLASDAGLNYQFVPTSRGFCGDAKRVSHVPVDQRLEPGWSLAPVPEDDPLGIEFCAAHTVVTRDPGRVLSLLVDVLGGTVIHEGPNEPRGTASRYVHLADAVFEVAVPDPAGAARADWETFPPVSVEAGPSARDTYHAITWKVADLDRAQAHLAAQGVRIHARSDDTLITDPVTSLGVPWGFTTSPVPGDPRRPV